MFFSYLLFKLSTWSSICLRILITLILKLHLITLLYVALSIACLFLFLVLFLHISNNFGFIANLVYEKF